MQIMIDATLFVHHNSIISGPRLLNLHDLAMSVGDIPGDVAEVGVFKGGSAYLLAATNPLKTVYVFDTFKGLPGPTQEDHHAKGEFSQGREYVEGLLSGFNNVRIFEGIFPKETGSVIAEKGFSFVHIDVDLYVGTLECLKFFYPRMSKGGIVVCDDYNAPECEGAKKAMDEFMEGKPERIQNGYECQVFIVKE